MNVVIDTEIFRNSLNKILSVVDRKNTRPILAYTAITTTESGIELSATDLEVSAKLIIPAKVSSKGSFCINAKTITDILRELPNGDLHLDFNQNDNLLNITLSTVNFSVLVYKTDDFPHLNFKGGESEIIISSKKILELINNSSYAISNDETRPYFNGLYLQIVDSNLRAVSTNGYRLALYEIEMNNVANEALINGIIIPRKGILELKRIAETEIETEIKVHVDDSFIYVNASDKYYLSIRLITREYPKYQAVIPTRTTCKLTVDKDAFLDAVKRVKIMSNEKSHGIKVYLSEKEITITANHPTLGQAIEKVLAHYEGKVMEIGFNARYLIDSLSTFDSGDVVIELNNELSPALVRSPSVPNYLGIVMPLKL